jgi:hypothetical protein
MWMRIICTLAFSRFLFSPVGDCSPSVPSCPNALVQFSWTSTGKPGTPAHHCVLDRSRPFAYLSLKQVREKLANSTADLNDRDTPRKFAYYLGEAAQRKLPTS